jgi:capsular exopolysaccharide synthesis family protein
MTTKYESVSVIEVNKENSDMLGLDPADRVGAGGNFDSLDASVTLQTEASALQSDSLAFEVVQQLGLEKRKEFALDPGWLDNWLDSDRIKAELSLPLEQAPLRRQNIHKVFKKNLKIKPVAGTRLIEVHFLNPDPDGAANVVNTLVSDFLERNFRTRSAATAQVSGWLSKELTDLKSQVENSQEKLNEAKNAAGILGSDETNNIVTAKLEELNRQLTSAQANRIMKQTVFQLASSGDPELISSIAGTSLIGGQGAPVNPNSLALLETLRTQQAQLKVQYAQASTKFGPAYPLVAQIESQLTALDSSIQSEVQRLAARAENDYRAARNSEDMLRALFEEQKAEANRLNDKAIQYTILKREVESGRHLYEDLLTKLKEGGVLAGLRSTNIVVVDPARATPEPARPSYPLNIGLGFALGLLGGIALAFVREGLDNTVRNPEQIESFVSLPCIGIVPDLATCSDLPRIERKGHKPTFSILANGSSQIAEAYRALRTWILTCNVDAPPKVIVVTSGLPQEGKTMTSMNTAMALAQQGAQVLLVEADLRRPSLLGARQTQPSGLREMLSNPNKRNVGFVQHPQIKELLMLPAGAETSSAAELLGSRRMQELVDLWRQEFDFVVIDTPPVLSFTDAVILARSADAVLFVIRPEQTTLKSCLRARDLFERANAPITGVLVNGANVNSPDYQHYGYSRIHSRRSFGRRRG